MKWVSNEQQRCKLRLDGCIEERSTSKKSSARRTNRDDVVERWFEAENQALLCYLQKRIMPRSV